jgi:hypothetical protein
MNNLILLFSVVAYLIGTHPKSKLLALPKILNQAKNTLQRRNAIGYFAGVLVEKKKVL